MVMICHDDKIIFSAGSGMNPDMNDTNAMWSRQISGKV